MASVFRSYALGSWLQGSGEPVAVCDASTGEVLGGVTSQGIDFAEVLRYGRTVGGPALRAMTFHQRALMLKRLAQHLMAEKELFYAVSAQTGATRTDSWIDIEGGIGTLFTYASKGRRELPNDFVYRDGPVEQLSKEGNFVGRHICVPREGAAVHINAFNFPVWGMLEKVAPTILAGMPAIVKPATVTAFLAHRVAESIVQSGILPHGALQLICGGTGDLFEHLGCEDVVTFTGSAATGHKLKSHRSIVEHSIRFNLEADSLNFSMLGPDVEPQDPEFEIFVKEVSKEMTVKAGQKCTAIRRILVPARLEDAVIKALRSRLEKVVIGDPRVDGVHMGPLASRAQQDEVGNAVARLATAGEVVIGDPKHVAPVGGDRERGAFFPVVLLRCGKPLSLQVVHDVEAFGPVSTVMPYSTLEEGVELCRRGRGSLVGSVVTYDERIARDVVLGVAPYHGRVLVLNRENAKESTGHGSPLPHLVHGGPGRAGGGEELGGMRSVLHYMQRTALQGTPTTVSAVANSWSKGGAVVRDRVHPFRKFFEELEIGEQLVTHRRTVTEADIVQFAGISGDFFYAHMDDVAARESLFERRVAHGYFVLAAAAGLFVDPAPGPVLANYGLDNLRFIKPVYVGDTIQVKLTCKEKHPKEGEDCGVVAWDVEVTNQADEPVAVYTVLTLVKRKSSEYVPGMCG